MTGYGSNKGVTAGMELSIELKSVNNRYLDVTPRLPRSFIFAEDSIKAAVGRHISRGKVDVFVNISGSDTAGQAVKVNWSLADGYMTALHDISAKYGLVADITPDIVARFPDVVSVEKAEVDAEAVRDGICDILEVALRDYDAMRAREGEKLKADILGRLVSIENMVSRVEERSPETVNEYREKLTQRMNEVLGSAGIDEQRILTEAAIYADKIAVDEETVRLRSHISQMRSMLETGSPVGRKLDFLIQEFNREANTIGSKCSDVALAQVVVDIKSEIEKIREQIQNIE